MRGQGASDLDAQSDGQMSSDNEQPDGGEDEAQDAQLQNTHGDGCQSGVDPISILMYPTQSEDESNEAM